MVAVALSRPINHNDLRANIVSLGPIQTGYIAPEAEPKIIADAPLGRLGEPEDVADVVTFLASHQAR